MAHAFLHHGEKSACPKAGGGELMGRHSDRSLITLHESANLIRRLSGPVVAAHHRLKELLGDGVGGWPMHWHARRCTHVGVDKTRRDCGSTPHPKPNLLGSKMLPPPPPACPTPPMRGDGAAFLRRNPTATPACTRQFWSAFSSRAKKKTLLLSRFFSPFSCSFFLSF